MYTCYNKLPEATVQRLHSDFESVIKYYTKEKRHPYYALRMNFEEVITCIRASNYEHLPLTFMFPRCLVYKRSCYHVKHHQNDNNKQQSIQVRDPRS